MCRIRLTKIRSSTLLAFVAIGLFVSLLNDIVRADEPATSFTAEQIEFFETKVRPLLVERCFSCHSAKAEKLKAGLYMDSREALLKGGESGTAIVAGKPAESLLIDAVRYQSYEMPPDGKLRDDEIASLVKWVEMGAPWPTEQSPSQPALSGTSYDWDELRAGHWAWQPISRPDVPVSKEATTWSQNSVDQFVFRNLIDAGLQPSPAASPTLLLRRLHLDLTGIPPMPDQIQKFETSLATDRQSAIADVIDQLLDTPQYGERWGRHWLDALATAMVSADFSIAPDRPTPGVTATGSSMRSTRTCLTTSSCGNRLPATCFLTLAIRQSRRASSLSVQPTGQTAAIPKRLLRRKVKRWTIDWTLCREASWRSPSPALAATITSSTRFHTRTTTRSPESLTTRQSISFLLLRMPSSRLTATDKRRLTTSRN
jgi:hypothetical protein